MTAASIAKRLLIQVHRWVGIVIGLMAIVWFASGIAMIYVGGMPQLTSEARLDHLPVLDVSQTRLTPAQAATRLEGEGAGPSPGVPRLLMVQGRPAYRFPGDRIVFADDGSLQAPLDEAGAGMVARQFLGHDAPGLRLLERLQAADQWTLSMRRGPLLKYDVGDAQGTELYVSPAGGRSGSGHHAQRSRQGVDRHHSALAVFLGAAAEPAFVVPHRRVALGFRLPARLAGTRTGLHAVAPDAAAGSQTFHSLPRVACAGTTSRAPCSASSQFTWAFSGLLSMEPFAWTNVPELSVDRDAMTGGAPQLASYDSIALAALPALVAPRFIKEIGFVRIHGVHYLSLLTSAQADAKALPRERLHQPYVVGGRAQEGEVLVEAATLERRDQPFDSGVILARLRKALPDVPVVGQQLLRDYDDYYYSRNREAPLPVLRVKLGDPLQTWLYVDPRNSEIVLNLHRYSRIERWLYNGLHSLDFRFWYSKRPLWDVVMITLLLGGLAASSLGFYYGVRRLVR